MQFKTIAALFALTAIGATQDIDYNDVPQPCRAVCQPVVTLTTDCDRRTEDDNDNGAAYRNCICQAPNARTDVPNCAACVAANGGTDFDDNDDTTPDNDVVDIVRTCNFPTASTWTSTGAVASPPPPPPPPPPSSPLPPPPPAAPTTTGTPSPPAPPPAAPTSTSRPAAPPVAPPTTGTSSTYSSTPRISTPGTYSTLSTATSSVGNYTTPTTTTETSVTAAPTGSGDDVPVQFTGGAAAPLQTAGAVVKYVGLAVLAGLPVVVF